MYIVSLHITGTLGIVPTATMSGAGCVWSEVANVDFDGSFPLINRRLQTFIGFRVANSFGIYPVGTPQYSDDPRLVVFFDVAPTTVRYIFDTVANVEFDFLFLGFPIAQIATNVGSGTSTLSTTLESVPTTNNLQYSVLARSTGTSPVAGTGNTLLTNGATAPVLISQVAVNRQTNSQSWTTNAESAMVTIDFRFPSQNETGVEGEFGKVIPFLV